MPKKRALALDFEMAGIGSRKNARSLPNLLTDYKRRRRFDGLAILENLFARQKNRLLVG